jgi:zinc transporter 2
VCLLTASLFPDGHRCHGLSKVSEQERREAANARCKLFAAGFLCFVFMIGEAVGGYFANSLAILTDAAHLLSDLLGFFISIFSLYMAQRPPSDTNTFGYG